MLRLPQRTDTTLFPHGFVGAITVAAIIRGIVIFWRPVHGRIMWAGLSLTHTVKRLGIVATVEP